jgi:hypothetical protein
VAHVEEVGGRANVVHAQERAGAAVERRLDRAQGACVARRGRAAGERPDEVLARDREQ